MAYLSPGIYVEEKSSGSKPIAGVGTSTAGFVGLATGGAAESNKATLVTNWSQYVKKFGDWAEQSADHFLHYAVYSFFAEGGTSCYVVRVDPPTGAQDAAIAASAEINDDSAAAPLMAIEATAAGPGGNNLEIVIEDPTNSTANFFNLTLRNTLTNEDVTAHENLTVLDVEATVINSVSVVVTAADAIDDSSGSPVPAKRPANGSYPLTGGLKSDDADFIGDKAAKTGLYAFDNVDDVNIIAVPDQPGDREVIIAGMLYCKNRGDCFFLVDPPREETPTGMKDFKEGTPGTPYSGAAFNNDYSALYYPWIVISDPYSGAKKDVPPSGLVAGTYAHTDSTRGVHKAPAGTSEGLLDSAIDIETIITKGEQDLLNPLGINVIRSFSASGICIWGARTLSSDAEWRYINIRRLFLYVEESIDKASQWIAFEPNEPALWGKVKRNISAFLKRVWRDGALFGSTPEEAFFVKIDEENNPPENRDAGQLIIEIGMAPVKPAEFVIIRISQKTG